jgi:hypothetical protein
LPYISRNDEGVIIEIHQSPPKENATWLEMNAPEMVEFLQQIETMSQARQVLSHTDTEMVRIIEDLIDILVEKQCFTYTELPEAVQKKLGTRKKIRDDMQVLDNLIDDDVKIL